MASGNHLKNYIAQIESHIPNHKQTNLKVSKSSIGWHLDHSLKVINNVSASIQASDPKTYKKNFSLLGKVFFTLGFFPRGKAQAPRHVKPPEIILEKDLLDQINDAKVNVEAIKALNTKAYFKHPMFGHISKKRVTRFLELHTNHHLKIINDIIKT